MSAQMGKGVLSVRELGEADIASIADYWLTNDHAFLRGMGVDVRRLPSREDLTHQLARQLRTPIEGKGAYCIIWELDGAAIGHCNTNPTRFGAQAHMHLHIWSPGGREKGRGAALVRMTLPYFFENLHLQTLYCEPYALNAAANQTLHKVGFEFIKEYVTIPGTLNFEQPVKRWRMSSESYREVCPDL